MGESYLQKKLFGRMKRVRTQASISSSIQETSFATRSDQVVGLTTTTTSAASTSHNISPASPMPTASVSTPHLNNMLIRRQMCSDEDDSVSNSIGDEDAIITSSSSGNLQARSTTPRLLAQLNGQQGRATKLKTTTKAILFFRRAASTLTSSGKGSRTSSSSSSCHIMGSSSDQVIRRQNTGDSLQSQGSQQQQAAAAAANEKVPQFIVPKMNALKLPLVCLIKSLGGELMREVFVHRYELGQYLIESLKVSLDIVDCKYFGLKMAKGFEDQEDLRNPWLDLNESVCKQIKSKGITMIHHQHQQNNNNNNCSNTSAITTTTANGHYSARSIDFYLRIKFYPPNLARVQDPFLRQYLWLQLRRDLRLGKLTSSMNNLTLLMACVLQYELGDYKLELCERIQQINILPNQDLIEEQATELWRTRLVGTKKHQAQMQFLRAAVILETYGFDYYPVRDHQRQRAYLLGFNYAGLKTIRNGRIVHHFRWHNISKISYERRMIIFHIYPTENSKRKQILGFKCLSNDDCQNLYMRLLEQKYFFTVDLAYFDKSIRRPSCLHTTTSTNSVLDWSASDDPSTSSSCQPIPLGTTNEEQDGAVDEQIAALSSFSNFDLSQPYNRRPSHTTNTGGFVCDEHQRFNVDEHHQHHRCPQAVSANIVRRGSNSNEQLSSNNSSPTDQLSNCFGCNNCSAYDSSTMTHQLIKSLSLQETAASSSGGGGVGSDQAIVNNSNYAPFGPATTTSQLGGETHRPPSPVAAQQQQIGGEQVNSQRSTTKILHRQRPYFSTNTTDDETNISPYEQRDRRWSSEHNDWIPSGNLRANSVSSNDKVASGFSWPDPAQAASDTGQTDGLWWTKVCVPCVSSTSGIRQRFMEFAESVFVSQPIAVGVQCQQEQQQHNESGSRVFMPAFRFCLVILLMNFVLRVTDSFSSALIELLTLTSPTQTSSTTITSAEQFDTQ